MKTILLLCVGAVTTVASASPTSPLTQGTFTEIIRNVSRLTPDGTATPASLNEEVKAPERVRTGANSRAELTTPDKTITRIGANTVFAFDTSQRTLHLDQGSVLFHAPKGVGGGTIKSGGASAAVLGTTIIVSATPGGGFKLIVLEGTAKATLENGKTTSLKAGQMVFILPGGNSFSDVLTINLGRLAANSQLVSGFSHPLPSLTLIEAAIHQQHVLIESGKAEDTGQTADDFHSGAGNGLNDLDPATHQTALHPNLTVNQIGAIIEGSGNPSGQGGGTGGGGPGGSGLVPISGKSPKAP